MRSLLTSNKPEEYVRNTPTNGDTIHGKNKSGLVLSRPDLFSFYTGCSFSYIPCKSIYFPCKSGLHTGYFRHTSHASHPATHVSPPKPQAG